ncbi:hypothetical protein SAMN02746089_01419 [Caldanaerobius fijiensis DSM 17918]|uniref:Uncharacterized protein n=1 Tax=Caldanaerobius fijiensis DSM 17918 TaxID=1121256 RepID=A0A1M4ZF51_9THEO|nr:hypothetical protein [Caldanaerobius fijiensis]SHF16673.1 hypothetical protein SAMN02746089_01419 [Caldanaerobius fijiensis DSM 17918]
MILNAILITLLYLIVAAIQVPPLVKNKKIRELVAYTLVLSLAYVLSIIQVFGIRIKNPDQLITWISRIF